MQIKIENYLLVSQETGGFDLVEIKKAKKTESKTGYIRKQIIAHNISERRAIKIIVAKTNHNNPITLSFPQYLIELKTQYDRIEKLFDIEILK